MRSHSQNIKTYKKKIVEDILFSMPIGNCSPAGSWMTAFIHSTLATHPRESSAPFLTLNKPCCSVTNSKNTKVTSPQAEKKSWLLFFSQPAVVICLPSIANPYFREQRTGAVMPPHLHHRPINTYRLSFLKNKVVHVPLIEPLSHLITQKIPYDKLSRLHVAGLFAKCFALGVFLLY